MADQAPIIIKKKKVSGGDGHHGGAWKVAYADFVTAMMAFFLLMWLLNATSEEQRSGLADYFSPTIPLSEESNGGRSLFHGDSALAQKDRPKNGDAGRAGKDAGDDTGGETKSRRDWVKIVEEPTPGEVALSEAREEGRAAGFEAGVAQGRVEGAEAGYLAALTEVAERAGVDPEALVTGDASLAEAAAEAVRRAEARDAAEDGAEEDAEAAGEAIAAAPSPEGPLEGSREERNDASAGADAADEASDGDPAARAARAARELEEERLSQIERAFNDIKANGEDGGALEQIRVRLTPAGLVIEIADADGEPLFASASAAPSPRLAELVEIVAPIISSLENDVEIVGHTDSAPFPPGATYTNWDLSSDRANAARRVLLGLGVTAERVARVAGAADRQPISDDPRAPQNRRIAITLLRSAPPEKASLTSEAAPAEEPAGAADQTAPRSGEPDAPQGQRPRADAAPAPGSEDGELAGDVADGARSPEKEPAQ